jgi:hypothetical protein
VVTIAGDLYPDNLPDGTIFIACGGYDSTNHIIRNVLVTIHLPSGTVSWAANTLHNMAVDPTTTPCIECGHGGRSGVSIGSKVSGVTPVVNTVGGVTTASNILPQATVRIQAD